MHLKLLIITIITILITITCTAFSFTTQTIANQTPSITLTSSIVDDALTLLDNPRSIGIKDNYAYIVSRSDTSITVVDITNPQSLSVVGQLQDAIALNNATFIKIQGNYGYISNGSNQITSINLTNPTNPVVIDTITVTGIFDMSLQGNYIYAATSPPSQTQCVQIVDISDPANLQLSGTLNDSLVCDGPNTNLVDGSYLYTYSTSGNDEHFSVWDISAGSSGTLLGTWSALNAGYINENCQDFKKRGTTVFAPCWQNDRIFAWDVSNPSSPQLTSVLTDPVNLDGAVYAQITSNYLIVTALFGHMIQIVDISNPSNMSIVTTLAQQPYTTSGYSTILKDNLLIVPNRDIDRVSFFTITIPSQPTPTPQIHTQTSHTITAAPSIPQLHAMDSTIMKRDEIFVVVPKSTFLSAVDLHMQRYPITHPLHFTNKKDIFFQISDIIDVWFIEYESKSRIFTPLQSWIFGINYGKHTLTNDGIHYFSESSLNIAQSDDDGKTWDIANTFRDANQKSVAIVTASGGKYMLVGKGRDAKKKGI